MCGTQKLRNGNAISPIGEVELRRLAGKLKFILETRLGVSTSNADSQKGRRGILTNSYPAILKGDSIKPEAFTSRRIALRPITS